MNRSFTRWGLGVLLALTVAQAPPALARPSGTVTGTATYRERMPLPRRASFEATLEEVARGDEDGVVIGRERLRRVNEVPLEFSISYDPRRIRRGAQYVVRATISERGRTLFETTRPYPVITRGHGDHVDLMLRRVRGRDEPGPGGDGSVAALTDTRWRPVQIGNRVVDFDDPRREPWIELDSRTGRVTGSGGCNRISGPYQARSGGSLELGPLVSTRMACADTDIENAFLRALDRTRRYRVRNRTLELSDDTGRVLVRLEERNLR